MRIGCTADLHYGIDGWVDGRIERFIRDVITPAQLDALIIAGDLAESAELDADRVGSRHAAILARLRAAVAGPVAFCAGNHDLWTTDTRIDSHTIYRERLAEISEHAGAIYLDREFLPLDGLTVVGCYGHFDYSLRETDLRIGGVEVTTEHYRRQTPPGYSQPVWMDGARIRWDRDDVSACAEICRAGAARLAAALAIGRDILFVSHGVPRSELNGHTQSPDPVSRFLNAFSGTLQLEALLRVAARRGGRVWSVSGHTHRAVERTQIDGVEYLNIGGTYGRPRLELLDPDAERPA